MKKKKPQIILAQYVGLKMEVEALEEMNSSPEKIGEKQHEVERIEQALENIADPAHRVVLIRRYAVGLQPPPWPQIAQKTYGGSEEKHMQAIYRLHGRALQSFDREYKKLKKESHP